MYHDGIVISTNDNIILYNKQTAKIFQVNQELLFNDKYYNKKIPKTAVDLNIQPQIKADNKLAADQNQGNSPQDC